MPSFISHLLTCWLLFILRTESVSNVETTHAARPLPLCSPDLQLHDYLLPPAESASCGLPLSRSYLFSKYNAILVAAAVRSNITEGDQVKVRIVACRPVSPAGADMPFGFWSDTQSVSSSEHWTLATCQATEVNFWGRITSKETFESVKVGRVSSSEVDTSCEWEASFSPAYPGLYTLEIANDWLWGSNQASLDECGLQIHSEWVGGTPLHLPPALTRGSPFSHCCNKCSVQEQCFYFTSTVAANNIEECRLYTNASTPHLISTKNNSGMQYHMMRMCICMCSCIVMLLLCFNCNAV